MIPKLLKHSLLQIVPILMAKCPYSKQLGKGLSEEALLEALWPLTGQ
jgi:hypothetical protein